MAKFVPGLDSEVKAAEPAVVSVIVLDAERPTAVIDVLNAAGSVVPPPARLGFGEKFTLSGRRSSDIGGAVTTWTWTLLPD